MSMHTLKPQHFAKLEDDLAACYCLVAHYRMSDLTALRNCWFESDRGHTALMQSGRSLENAPCGGLSIGAYP
jgi:hypothetical protein